MNLTDTLGISISRARNDFKIMIFVFICLLGIFANAINIAVFIMPNMKDSSFKYMLTTSIVKMFYLKLLLIRLLISCENCSLKDFYITQIYHIIVYDYLTSILALFSTIADNILSLQRYLILVNNSIYRRVSQVRILFLILVFSIIYYSPVLFFKNIHLNTKNCTNSNETQRHYSLVLSYVGQSLFGKIVPIVLSMIRMFFDTFLLAFINILNVYEFRKRFSTNRPKS